MRQLLAGIAALAIASGLVSASALAQPHNGPDKGPNIGPSNSNGNPKQQSGKPAAAPGNSGKQSGETGKGPGSHERIARPNAGTGPDRGPGPEHGNASRGPDKGKPQAVAGQTRGKANGQGNAAFDGGPPKGKSIDKGPDKRRGDDFVDRIARLPYQSNHGLIAGCPPGLAKKNPPCVPPGLARKDDYGFGSFYRPSFFGLRGIGDGRYYYGDGYLYRLGADNRVGGFIPLLAGALGIGRTWPGYYSTAAVPGYYQSYYGLQPRGYRYADNVLYRVDPETAAIVSIAALLTGDDFRVGQPMPSGYDVYNVPYGYRDRYYDRPDAYYRYSDGYIYQVDPETRLIAAAIELLI